MNSTSEYLASGTDVDEVNRQRIAEGLQPFDLSEFIGSDDGSGSFIG